MKYDQLDLREVELTYEADRATGLVGMTKEELDVFSKKMAKVTQAVDEDKLDTMTDVLKELLPQLTPKEAMLLIYSGVEAGIQDALEKAHDPLEQLAFLLQHASKKKQAAE